MQLFLNPSLEHIVLVKIGISLWNQNDISVLISKISYMGLIPSDWKKIEEIVIDKVPQLSLPQLLKEKVIGVIKPIGMQIFEWINYYRKYNTWVEFEYDLDLDLPAHLPDELCWTPQGTVDRKRTAKMLVNNKNLNVSRRYILACDYFLEDDIIRFWKRLPEHLKDYDWRGFPVSSFWSNNMKSGGAYFYISYKNVFYLSVGDSNKVAAKYFLQKLNPQEREQSLKELAGYIEDADVLWFLLSEMDEEEQMLVFKSDPWGVLSFFLQWPFQGFFFEVANCMWNFLSRDNYDKILRGIISKVREGYRDCNYQKLFREFWQKSPSALKDSFIDEIDRSSLLQYLFDIKDKENIRLILKDVTITEKFIYCDETKNICQRYIRDDEWNFLEFFIRECLTSKNEMLKVKEEMEKCMYFKEHCSATKKQKWNRLFDFSDDSICKYGKRSIEDESSSSKHFQSLQ